jgi:hypothetical protein
MNEKLYLMKSNLETLKRENRLEGCGNNLKSIVNKNHEYCIMHTLGQKHNFTIRGLSWYIENKQPMYFSVIQFGTVVDDYFLNISTNKVIHTNFEFDKFEFVIITQFPSSSSSFETYLSPFDLWTWSLIGVGCILVTLVLGFNRIMFIEFHFHCLVVGYLVVTF